MYNKYKNKNTKHTITFNWIGGIYVLRINKVTSMQKWITLNQL